MCPDKLSGSLRLQSYFVKTKLQRWMKYNLRMSEDSGNSIVLCAIEGGSSLEDQVPRSPQRHLMSEHLPWHVFSELYSVYSASFPFFRQYLNIQKMKIMAPRFIISWQIAGEKGNEWQILFTLVPYN